MKHAQEPRPRAIVQPAPVVMAGRHEVLHAGTQTQKKGVLREGTSCYMTEADNYEHVLKYFPIYIISNNLYEPHWDIRRNNIR